MAEPAFVDYAQQFENDLALSTPRTGTIPSLTPYQALRATTSINTMRENGTFFTSSQLAERVWLNEVDRLNAGAIVFDPAVGAGDLLIPLARHMSRTERPMELRVNDIDPALAGLSEKRLKAIAGSNAILRSTHLDYITKSFDHAPIDLMVMNPPFVSTQHSVDWASGRVNAAAVFVERALEQLNPGSRLIAILPDVLRSGSRYARWRAKVETFGTPSIDVVERTFDDDTDVHVFIIKITLGRTDRAAEWRHSSSFGKPVLGDLFDIRVGPVVPHRDAYEGPSVPFVNARNLSSGISESRQYAGRLEQGPLVLVNRTSRPGDKQRVRARLWNDPRPAAIDNHLLIVRPKTDSKMTNDDALRVLGTAATASFLDERIRCRHLTVSALKEIPWQT